MYARSGPRWTPHIGSLPKASVLPNSRVLATPAGRPAGFELPAHQCTPNRYTLGEPARTHGPLLKSRHQFSLIASRGSERAVSARSRPSRKACGIGSSRPLSCAGHTGQKAKLGWLATAPHVLSRSGQLTQPRRFGMRT